MAWRMGLWLLILAAFATAAAAADEIIWGQDGPEIWFSLAIGATGFRLEPGEAGSCRLLLPDRRISAAETMATGLLPVPQVRLEPIPEAGGTALLLPFSVSSLAGVELSGGSWRFRFRTRVAFAGLPEGDEYRLGIRDVVQVSVFGHEDLSRSDAVPPSGHITFPLVGDLQVAGRTVAEIEEELQRRLAADFLVDPQVNVSVLEYESQWVNVIGLVRTPGKYPIKGRTTLIDLVTQAGGLTEDAGATIVVTRPIGGSFAETSRFEVSRDDLFSADNDSANIPLAHGDVINVPKQAVFYIQGEVGRPGSYPLEQGYTVLKAISIAGGFSQWADRKAVELLRDEDGEQQKLELNIKAIADRKQPDMELRPEDIILVKRRLL